MRRRGEQEKSLTGPHRFVSELLRGMEIAHSNEFAVYPAQGVRPYMLDIYLDEWHLAVEVDGPFHQKGRDQRRDAALLEQGIPTLRIDARSCIAKNTNSIKESIATFIMLHAETAKLRSQLWKTKWLS